MKGAPITLPPCAVAGCTELAVTRDKQGRPMCRKHWRMALRAQALLRLLEGAKHE